MMRFNAGLSNSTKSLNAVSLMRNLLWNLPWWRNFSSNLFHCLSYCHLLRLSRRDNRKITYIVILPFIFVKHPKISLRRDIVNCYETIEMVVLRERAFKECSLDSWRGICLINDICPRIGCVVVFEHWERISTWKQHVEIWWKEPGNRVEIMLWFASAGNQPDRWTILS